ncbi:hypothetical protein LDENG_00052500 [Lucifuga dentata]|nr:hypothetical protein LDENG_00052500 [Lucifuga dentata]
MLAAVRCMLSKLVSPVWRMVEVEGDGILSNAPAIEDIRHLQGGVVTQLCLDYGLIDNAIYFTSGEVLGGMPVKEGDTVNCIAVRDGIQGGWKAIRVQKSVDAWEEGGRTSVEADSMQLHPLIGTVTSFDGHGGYINQTTFFPFCSLWEGYEPMKGDWVQAKYFINPSQWTTQAHSVAPLRYCRLDQVCVTSLYGRNGVVEDSVFFSLNSLLLPANYQPLPGHLVNLVMVESSQSMYSWRALCMAPCLQSMNVCAAAPLSEAVIQSLMENKGGVDVTDCGHFGHLRIGERRELVFWIQNNGSKIQRLKYCEFACWDSEKQFTLVKVNKPMPQRHQQQCLQEICSESGTAAEPSEKQDGAKEVEIDDGKAQKETISFPIVRKEESEVDIQPGQRLCIGVGCEGKSLGACAELLLLHFSSFTIGRRLEVTVGSKEENLLHPSIPYTSHEAQPAVTMATHVITVSAPKSTPRLLRRQLPSFLGNYPVPQALRDCVEAQSDVLVVCPCLGEVLSPSNMSSRFSALLWLEELHAEREMKEFNISGALLKKGAVYLHLEVLGLAEGRPNINIGDRIVLKKPMSDNTVVEYISYVTEMSDESVSLRVNLDLQHSYIGEPLQVEFCYNRSNLLRPYLKLLSFSFCCTVLFPTGLTIQPPQWTGEWIEEPEQTKTIEDDKVYHFLPSGRVLVCTPSNSAADLICIRLHDSGFLHAASLARVNATHRQEEHIPEVLKPYSKAGEDIRHASFHRIVVSTCSSAAMFYNVGIQVGHFTHVFLDEAGQATEPESLIPISFLSEKDGQIVLAGDPFQLGPVVKSKLASAFGLGVSLMERLMANPLYTRQEWGYNPKLVTKLIYNYRSHEALLTLPSRLFYRGELCVKAPKIIVESLCHWKSLPKKGFPLFFHGIRGTEMREGNSPSWFNPVEAVQVMLYSCQLAKKLSHPVATSDIGIIAPYKKQCEKIRVLLSKVGLSDIKVGSVEEFQGQEFLVIIMSTVSENRLWVRTFVEHEYEFFQMTEVLFDESFPVYEVRIMPMEIVRKVTARV